MTHMDFVDLTIEASNGDSVGPEASFTLAKVQEDQSLDPFCGPCLVLDFSGSQTVDDKAVQSEVDKFTQELRQRAARVSAEPVDDFVRILIKTRTADRQSMAKLDWPACVKMLESKGAVLIGCDDGVNDALSGFKACALFNLNLSNVEGGTIGMLVSGPEKLKDEQIVPCRAVILFD